MKIAFFVVQITIDSPDYPSVTWFHEHGHYIDAALRYISDDDVFRQLLIEDSFIYIKI